MVQQINYGQCVKPKSGSRRLNHFWESPRTGTYFKNNLIKSYYVAAVF